MRLMFVALAGNVHTARWVNQLYGQGWDLHLFPVCDYSYVHPDLGSEVTVHSVLRQPALINNHRVRQTGLWWPYRRGARVARAMKVLAPRFARPAERLARLIHRLKPDVVHSLEMQHAGYLTSDARDLMIRAGRPFPPWLFSAWGQDFYFEHISSHANRIRRVMAGCDYFIPDCQRDVDWGKRLGFSGKLLGVYPTAGGYHLEAMRVNRTPGPASARRVVLLKGRHLEVGGRAMHVLAAFERQPELLSGRKLVIYAASPEVTAAAGRLAAAGQSVEVLSHDTSHHTLIRLMGAARVAIGVAVSDGTPNAMLEAMVMGALPVQSDTGSTAEWIRHGVNGLLVRPDDPTDIAAAVRRSLTDDALVDAADAANSKIVDQRIDSRVIGPEIVAMYQRVVNERAALEVTTCI